VDVYIDTDANPTTVADVDCRLLLGQHVDAVKTFPSAFGDVVARIFRDYERRLDDPDALDSGSRTLRAMTEIAIELNFDALVAAMRTGIKNLLKDSVDAIQVVIVASTGGGCGSAAAILLAEMLNQPHFRGAVEQGLCVKNRLRKPIMFAIDPWARVDGAGTRSEVNTGQALRIKANMYAFREEAARLSHRNAIQFYVILGNTNEFKVHLRTPRAAHHYLGLLLYSFLAGYGTLNSRLVDSGRDCFMKSGIYDPTPQEESNVQYDHDEEDDREEDKPNQEAA
jgi:hypothetical protein